MLKKENIQPFFAKGRQKCPLKKSKKYPFKACRVFAVTFIEGYPLSQICWIVLEFYCTVLWVLESSDRFFCLWIHHGWRRAPRQTQTGLLVFVFMKYLKPNMLLLYLINLKIIVLTLPSLVGLVYTQLKTYLSLNQAGHVTCPSRRLLK